jgi:hypothetical protein
MSKKQQEEAKQQTEPQATEQTAPADGIIKTPAEGNELKAPEPTLVEALVGDSSKPYGHPDPAPGAAGYEAPKLNPEPGSVEYLLAHPGEITTGTITRDNPGELKSHEEIRAEKDANGQAA